MRDINRWEHNGRFEHAATREEAAALLGCADPNEVQFAGFTAKLMPEPKRSTWERVRTGVYRIVPQYGA